MRKKFFMIIMIIPLIIFLLPDHVVAITPTWEGLNESYMDTDSDGEKDDYLGYDVRDRVLVADVLLDFESYPSLGITFLTLRSDPENIAVFGNTLDSTFTKGKGIILYVDIIEDVEADGDDKETYQISKIMAGIGGGNDEDPSSASDTLSRIGVVAICCLPEIIVVVIVGIISFFKAKDKREKESVKNGQVPPNPHSWNSAGSGTQYSWDSNYLNQSTPSSPSVARSPPGNVDQNSEKQSLDDDMKGLDDFMATMGSTDD
jgi:hypothetical protein